MQALFGRILNVRPGEWRRIFFLGAIIFTFILGITWAQIVIPAAFLEQVGVELLPYIFIGDAIAVIITMMIYSAFADRYSHDWVMIGLISIGVTAILVGRVLLALDLIRPAYLYLYILFRILTEAIGLCEQLLRYAVGQTHHSDSVLRAAPRRDRSRLYGPAVKRRAPAGKYYFALGAHAGWHGDAGHAHVPHFA
jgi:hypothetical protein